MSGEIKLKKIISSTSEDDGNKAQNLLNHGGKWVCAKNTEQTKHSVTIQLEKETKIRQVNIENEYSAFIEVWVGREGSKSDDDFKTLLEATSFMTPSESKSSSNGNRLKIFTNESLLNKDACELDSSVVKILCTQPFNKDLQFGIASIKLFDKVNNDDVKDAAKLNTGVFSLKKELSDSKPSKEPEKKEERKEEAEKEDDNEKKKESLYDKWKKNSKSATAYDTDSDDEEKKKKSSTKDESKPTTSRNADTSKPGRRSNEDRPNGGSILRGVIFALSGFVNPLRGEIRDKGMKLGAKYRPDWTDDCTHLVTAFSNTPKVKQVKKAKKGVIVTKDWIYECEKAGKALDANDYEIASDSDSSDEDDDSKPRRAAKVAVAKIAKMKKRDELLDSDEEEEEAENSDDRDFIVNSSDEEEEDVDISESEESDSSSSSSSSDGDKKKKRKKKEKKATKKKENKAKKLTKKKTSKRKSSSSSSSSSSSEDEDDLEKYKKKKEKELKQKKQKRAKKDDVDEEESSTKKKLKNEDNEDKENKKEESKKPANMKKSVSSSSSKTVVNSDMEADDKEEGEWKLPTFFDEKTFFIVPDYDAKKRKTLSRIIFAYGGNVSDYMSDEVDYVVTDKKWDKDFDEALKENKKLKFVESDWLNTCNSRKKLIPYQPFEVVPDA